jgi:hypothetical protein
MTSINPLVGRVWSRDPWPEPFPAWLKMGIETPERIYTSHLYFPGAMDRALISGGHDIERFALVVGDPPGGFITLVSRDTQDRQVVPYGEVTALSMAAYAFTGNPGEAQPQSFDVRIQAFHVDAQGRPQRRWQRDGVNICSFAGTGNDPLIFRTPVNLPMNQPVMFRATNLGTTTVQFQLMIDCVRRRYE